MTAPMIFVLDNYDSFTWNLVQRLGEIDPALDIRVARNDQTSLDEIERLSPERIIISPGPCTPREAGLSCEVVTAFGPRVPLLGVCLGHQCISDAFGGQVVRADRLMHGKVSLIHHNGEGLFAGLKNPFTATRYHSLTIEKASKPDILELTAWTEDGEIMGVQHKTRPIHGVQFHPESIATECGHELLANFLDLAGVRRLAAV